MCCFSSEVDSVSRTRIFARLARQDGLIAYAMTLSAPRDVAMILPLPTPPNSPENAVSFIDLSACPTLFDQLEAGFPRPFAWPRLLSAREDRLTLCAEPPPPLPVSQVGSFEASFVPTQRDFARLDPRFRIAPEVWSQMPDYADYGFAVFKLRAGRDMEFHPMAFRFPTRFPDLVFFPTVHVHEGRWNSRADFDHTLYLQAPDQRRPRGAWVRSPRPASRFVRTAITGGLVDPDSPVYRREIAGGRANADVLAELR